MSEIRIILELGAEAQALKEVIGDLEKFRDIVTQIKANKGALASVQDFQNVQKLTAELKKAELQLEALSKKRQADTEKENTKLRQQSGILGQLISKKKELQSSLISAKSIEDVRKINSELAKTNLEIVKLKNTGVSSFNTFEKALASFQFKFNFLGNLFASMASGPMTLLTSAISNIGSELVELFTQSEKRQRISEQQAKFDEKEIENLIELARKIKKVGEAYDELSLQRAVIQGDINEQQAEQIRLTRQNEIDVKTINLEFQKRQDEMLELAKQNNVSFKKIRINGQIEIKTSDDKLFNELVRLDTEKNKSLEVAENDFQNGMLALQNEAAKQNKEDFKEFLNDKGDINTEYHDKRVKKEEELTDKLLKEQERLRKESLDALKKLNEAQQERDKKNQLERLKVIEQLGKSELELKILALTKERDELFKNDEFTSDERVRIEQDFQLKITKLREDARDKRVKAESDARQKEKDEADNDREKAKEAERKKSEQYIEQLDKDTDALFKALEQRNEHEQKMNADKLSAIDKNIELQQERAIAGLSNTLDFENAERARALEEQNRLEKQAQKQKEVQQLTEIFLEFMKVYASEKPSTAAAFKALSATLLAKGISKAFAAEGGMGEDIKDKTMINGSHLSKSHGAGKDIEVIMSTKEGILTENEIQNLGGSKGFYALKDLLANPINDDLFGHQQQSFAPLIIKTDDKMTNVLSDKIDILTEVIKNKKELTVYRNVMGELVIDEKQNRIRTSTTMKDNTIKNKHPLD